MGQQPSIEYATKKTFNTNRPPYGTPAHVFAYSRDIGALAGASESRRGEGAVINWICLAETRTIGFCSVREDRRKKKQ